MKDLLSELIQARYRAAGGALDEAQNHITEAMELVRDAFGGCGTQSLSAREIRAYVSDAHISILNGYSSRAVDAIGSALEMLEPKSEGE